MNDVRPLWNSAWQFDTLFQPFNSQRTQNFGSSETAIGHWDFGMSKKLKERNQVLYKVVEQHRFRKCGYVLWIQNPYQTDLFWDFDHCRLITILDRWMEKNSRSHLMNGLNISFQKIQPELYWSVLINGLRCRMFLNFYPINSSPWFSISDDWWTFFAKN